MMASSAFGQINLDKTKVIYTTTDTITSDEGEAITFSSSSLVNGFNAAGLALDGTDTKDNGFFVAFRNDYTDPETGFTMPKGYYRGAECQGTWSLYGKFVNPTTMETIDDSKGFTNLKKVILYIVPAGYYVSNENGYNAANWQTLFSGRVQARYCHPDSANAVRVTNQAYREVTASRTDYNSEDWKNCVSVLSGINNWSILEDNAFTVGYNGAYITMDAPYKISVDLTNSASTDDLDAILSDKMSDFTKLNMSENAEADMVYYFANVKDCSSSADAADASPSSTGYNLYAGRWGHKVNWSTKTPIQVEVKKGLIVVGIALVSATDGAEKEYLDASAGPTAAWSADADVAYGTKVTSMPAEPWGDRRIGNATGITNINAVEDAVNAPLYNLAGQRVSDSYQGIVIQNGKKFFNHK